MRSHSVATLGRETYNHAIHLVFLLDIPGCDPKPRSWDPVVTSGLGSRFIKGYNRITMGSISGFIISSAISQT